ncbi:hypothetical protein FM107_06140 [Sphingobacterium sp. JB170]|nr:hypothetical protein FM107_06140 [Sphingobacterium sp. JB170]
MLFTGMSLATFAQENNNVVTDTAERGKKHHRKERVMEKKNPEEIAKIKTDRLDKELKFTDEQRAKVYAIQMEDVQKTVAYRDQMNAIRDTHRQEMRLSRDKMSEVLTSEQNQALKDKFKTHKKRKMMHHRGKRSRVQPADNAALENVSSDTAVTK